MMGRKGWTILAGVALTAAAPLAAQEPEPQAEFDIAEAVEAGGPPPLAGMDAAQIAEFFTLMSASPALDAELAPLIELMFDPGEAEPGWQDSGIDIIAALDALPGGRAANLLRDTDEEVLSVTDLSGAAQADFTGFASLQLRAAPPGGTNERTLVSFEPGIWLDLATQRSARGKAQCYSGLIGLTLHAQRPPQSWSEEEVAMIGVLVAMMDRVAAREVCLVYTREGERFASRTFLPDGRPLPNVDADSQPMIVMPADALDAFIREQEPPAPE